jgi:hypothetical protein
MKWEFLNDPSTQFQLIQFSVIALNLRLSYHLSRYLSLDSAGMVVALQ